MNETLTPTDQIGSKESNPKILIALYFNVGRVKQSLTNDVDNNKFGNNCEVLDCHNGVRARNEDKL